MKPAIIKDITIDGIEYWQLPDKQIIQVDQLLDFFGADYAQLLHYRAFLFIDHVYPDYDPEDWMRLLVKHEPKISFEQYKFVVLLKKRMADFWMEQAKIASKVRRLLEREGPDATLDGIYAKYGKTVVERSLGCRLAEMPAHIVT